MAPLTSPPPPPPTLATAGPAGELATLVTRAQKGDRGAFERLVQATARLVYAQIAAGVRDRQKAEDLTQETFVLAWKGIGGVAAPEGIVGWLLTLARNRMRDAAKFEARKKRAGPTGGDTASVADDAPGPGETAELSEARGRALAVLEELPEEYRRVLAMRYLGGADYEQIRRALGLTDGALRGLLNRGMAMMRERMTNGNRDKVTG